MQLTPRARVPRCTARVTLPNPGGSTSTLLTLLLAFVRSFADDQPAGMSGVLSGICSTPDVDTRRFARPCDAAMFRTGHTNSERDVTHRPGYFAMASGRTAQRQDTAGPSIPQSLRRAGDSSCGVTRRHAAGAPLKPPETTYALRKPRRASSRATALLVPPFLSSSSSVERLPIFFRLDSSSTVT